jgi:peptidase M50B-like protein
MGRAAAGKRFDWWEFLLLCAIFLGLAALWNTIWVYPLKLFVVLLHEVSHGIAALATGGRIVSIAVYPEEGGATLTLGGAPFVITSAGYVGSLLFGVAILLVSARTRLSQYLTMLLGIGAVSVALFCMREGRWFAAGCGLVFASLAPLPRRVSELALRVVGVTSCLYAILDIKSDVIDRPNAPSDAAVLAARTGVPSVIWGVLWIVISLVVTVYAAKWAVTGAKDEPERAAKGRVKAKAVA